MFGEVKLNMKQLMNSNGIAVYERSPGSGRNLVLTFPSGVEVSIAMEIEHDGWKGTSVCVSRGEETLFSNDNVDPDQVLIALRVAAQAQL